MRWHIDVLILLPFLGGGESLISSVMFHCDLKWQARLVKREWCAEGRGSSVHDKRQHAICGVGN